jgi:putative photosynthetic complex assembly protein 2
MLSAVITAVLAYLGPALFVVLLWAALTGALIWLNRQPPCYSWLVLASGLLVIATLSGLLDQLGAHSSRLAPYLGFAAGMLIYSWHELAFFAGLLTGPRPGALPAQATGWWRLWYACLTHLYHDLALALSALSLWLVRHDEASHLALLTLLLLWAMQHSAKLNILLGVPNMQVGWLPPRLRYLASYWRRRPSNPFFVPSLIAGLLLTALCWQRAAVLGPGAPSVGLLLLGWLSALAVLEHCLLVIPWPSTLLVPALPDAD